MIKYRELKANILKQKDCDIIIRVRNERDNLKRLFNQLYAQKDVCFNIIVLDTESEDGTTDLLKAYDDITIYSVRKDDFNYGDSLDFLVSKCVSNYVFSFSAHVLLDNNDYLLRQTIDYFIANSNVIAGCFRQVKNLHTGCSAYEEIFLRLNFPRTRKPRAISKKFNRLVFSNAGAVYRTSVVKKNRFGQYNGLEDKIWAYENMKTDRIIVYFGNMNIQHSHDESNEYLERRILINYVSKMEYEQKEVFPLFIGFKYFLGTLFFLPLRKKLDSIKYGIIAYKASNKAIGVIKNGIKS